MRLLISLSLVAILIACGGASTAEPTAASVPTAVAAAPAAPEQSAWPSGHGGMVGGKALASANDVATTTARLETAIKDQGFTHFTTIDHAANAANAGLEMRPTRVIIFGNPQVGTKLMTANPTIALSLPLRIAVYQDASDQVWIIYEEPAVLLRRHGISDMDAIVAKMSAALAGLTQTAPAQRPAPQ